MSDVISKELLSEVLEINDINLIIYDIDFPNIIEYTQYANITRGVRSTEINIHELAHKCKEWAKLKGYILGSWANENLEIEIDYYGWSYDCQVFYPKEGMELFYVKSTTEPEAIFKACQWILENKEEG